MSPSKNDKKCNTFLIFFSVITMKQNLRFLSFKGTGHNKFVRRGPSLSGVGGLTKTPPTCICKHHRQNFIGFKI